ncbi:hypothetical protein BC830DRAFT_649626 [Chytriomyces sp. MP71]|nr:hypothetical protein BC830DRAFT_649626 [Chytriomyces sp. MP71]
MHRLASGNDSSHDEEPPRRSRSPPDLSYINKHDMENRMVVVPLLTYLSPVLLDLSNHTIQALHVLFSALPGHPHRYTYALAGLLFSPKSPSPFGGPRKAPGYVAFRGPDCAALLQYIIGSTYKVYRITRDARLLEHVCKCVNSVVALQECGCKDLLDERVLQGMRKAGHVPWLGAARIPEQLGHMDTVGVPRAATTVEFSVRRQYVSRYNVLDSDIVVKEEHNVGGRK